jgi:hypothetical protein
MNYELTWSANSPPLEGCPQGGVVGGVPGGALTYISPTGNNVFDIRNSIDIFSLTGKFPPFRDADGRKPDLILNNRNAIGWKPDLILNNRNAIERKPDLILNNRNAIKRKSAGF